MDKLDKEVLYWSIWKLIQYIYGIAILLAGAVGIITILYFLKGMKDDKISQSGLIKLWIIIISVIVLRNILKPYFKKKTNNYMD